MNNIKRILLIAALFAAVGFNLFSQTGASPAPKKIEFEASLGIGGINPDTIYRRTSGIDSLIGQYANFYQLNTTVSGSFDELKRIIPFNISANYLIKPNLYLKAGIDYGAGSVTAQKTFQLAWTGFNESYAYDITHKISYLIPHLGIGYRFPFLDVYGAVGLGFASFNYTEDLAYTETGSSSHTGHDLKLTGKAAALILGVKYRVKINKNPKKSIYAFAKLEALALKVNSWKGDRTTTTTNGSTNTVTGTLYSFAWNPYGSQSIDYWDVYETPPTDPDLQMRNFTPLKIQLSGIRLMIGISF